MLDGREKGAENPCQSAAGGECKAGPVVAQAQSQGAAPAGSGAAAAAAPQKPQQEAKQAAGGEQKASQPAGSEQKAPALSSQQQPVVPVPAAIIAAPGVSRSDLEDQLRGAAVPFASLRGRQRAEFLICARDQASCEGLLQSLRELAKSKSWLAVRAWGPEQQRRADQAAAKRGQQPAGKPAQMQQASRGHQQRRSFNSQDPVRARIDSLEKQMAEYKAALARQQEAAVVKDPVPQQVHQPPPQQAQKAPPAVQGVRPPLVKQPPHQQLLQAIPWPPFQSCPFPFPSSPVPAPAQWVLVRLPSAPAGSGGAGALSN